VLAAALGVLSALFALQTAQISKAKEQAQTSTQNKETDLTALQGQFDELKRQNETLQYENGQLKLRLGLPSPTAGPQQPTGASARHSGAIVLSASGGEADLDSLQSDLQWRGKLNQYAGLGNLGYQDLGYDGTRVLFGNGTVVLFLGSTKADYETCRSRTGYGNVLIDNTTIQPGDYFCMKTGEHRYSAVRLTQMNSSKATFDVVTYDPPES